MFSAIIGGVSGVCRCSSSLPLLVGLLTPFYKKKNVTTEKLGLDGRRGREFIQRQTPENGSKRAENLQDNRRILRETRRRNETPGDYGLVIRGGFRWLWITCG